MSSFFVESYAEMYLKRIAKEEGRSEKLKVYAIGDNPLSGTPHPPFRAIYHFEFNLRYQGGE